MNEINSEMKSLERVFTDHKKNFHIPDFQRDFVWGQGEADQLFDDILEDTENLTLDSGDLQGYLLGNVVLIEQDKRYLVVDGQQRITTITLLYKIITDRIKQIISTTTEEREKERWLRQIGNLYSFYEISDDSENFLSLRVTHDETLEFGKYYRNILRNGTAELLHEYPSTNTKSDSQVEEVYQTLSSRLSELSDEEVSRLVKYLNKTVKLIVTTSSSESKAFQLFEVLNDRGRSLEPMDLVKNNFLKILNQKGFSTSQIREFNEDWNSFLQNLYLTPKMKIKSSTFIKHFIVSEYGKNIKQEHIFDFFSKPEKNNVILDGAQIIRLAKILDHKSKIYASIEKDVLNNDFIKDSNELYAIFKIVSIKQLHPILMNFYDSSIEIKEKVIDICLRYAATTIFASIQTNTIEKDLPQIILNLKKGNSDEDKLTQLNFDLTKIIRTRIETLKNSISTKNFVNSNGKPTTKALDILKFIELYFYKTNLILKPVRGRKISLEHIMPQKTSIEDSVNLGFFDSEDQQNHLNKIGNLTLLYNDENSAASNLSFEEKKNIYKNSEFKITRSLIKDESTGIKHGKRAQFIKKINELSPIYDTNKWDKEMINRRSINIAELLQVILLPQENKI